MIRLAADQDWLHKATKEIAKYWRHKRERRQSPLAEKTMVCAWAAPASSAAMAMVI
jgi:hypothetical protein